RLLRRHPRRERRTSQRSARVGLGAARRRLPGRLRRGHRHGQPATSSPLIITLALIERFGLFIIIVLGEIVTGVVNGLAAEPTNALPLAVALIAVVVGFGAWWTYFDFAGHRAPRPTPAATAQWTLSHLPLTAAVAAMGAAMVTLV